MAFDTSIDAVAYLYTYGDKDAERSYVGLKTQSGTEAKIRWDGSSPYREVEFGSLSLNNASQIYTLNHTGVDLGSSNNFLWLGGVEQTCDSTRGTLSGTPNLDKDHKFHLGASLVTAGYDEMIGEYFHYVRDSSDAEIVENANYLQKKWGKVNDNSKAPGGVHTGLVLWLDADDSSTVSTAACTAAVASPNDGNAISCFKDKSGKGNHLSSDQGSPTYQTDEFNSRSVIRFAGSENMTVSDLMGMTGGNESFTVFAVANRSQTTSDTSLISFGDNETTAKERWDMRITANGRYGSFFKSGTVSVDSAQIVESANKHAVISMSYNGGGVNEPTAVMIYENGASITEKSAGGSASGDAAIASTPMLHLGSRPDDSAFHSGDIAEVIIYTRVLSDAERQSVEAYLAQVDG